MKRIHGLGMPQRLRDQTIPLGILVGVGLLCLLVLRLSDSAELRGFLGNVLASVMILAVGILFLDDVIQASRLRRFRPYVDELQSRVIEVVQWWPHSIEPFLPEAQRASAHGHSPRGAHAPTALRDLVTRTDTWPFEECADCLARAEQHLRGARAELSSVLTRWGEFAEPDDLAAAANYERAITRAIAFAQHAGHQMRYPNAPGDKTSPETMRKVADEIIREGAKAGLHLYERLLERL